MTTLKTDNKIKEIDIKLNMPEGPEVVHRAAYLCTQIVDICIVTSVGNWSDRVNQAFPATIVNVESYGKALYLVLDNDRMIEVHFGLNGSMRLHPNELEDLHGVQLDLKDGTGNVLIRFVDEKNMGCVKLVQGTTINRSIPDVCVSPVHLIRLSLEKERKRRSVIATVLMDQKVLAGIGNYLRAEILYEARISPKRKCNSLSDEELENLSSSIHNVCRGFVDKTRLKMVYGKEVDVHNNAVVKEKISSRWMYHVPKLQT